MTANDVPKKWQHLRPQTIQLLRTQGFYDPRENKFGAIAPPEQGLTGKIYTSVAYTAPPEYQHNVTAYLADIFGGMRHGYVYPRLSRGTPPIEELSERLLDFELGETFSRRHEYDVLLFGSGMSAILFCALGLADGANRRVIISSPYLYGGTYHLFTEYLPRLRISCSMVNDPLKMREWYQEIERLGAERTAFLYWEDDANPTLIKLDNYALATVARHHNIFSVCDRTIGTSILEQPLLDGVGVVIHSASKEIGGRSGGLGGALVGEKGIVQRIRDGWFAVGGPVMDPRVADYMLFGLRDLKKRMEQKIACMELVAMFLRNHPRVAKVYGPGGSVLAFEIKGEAEDAKRFIESLQFILVAPHLGHVRTLVIHPYSTTHAQIPEDIRKKLGITPTLIRLAGGLEDLEDIIHDLTQALAA